MLARRRALPLPKFSGAPADRIVDPVERDQPGVQQVKALSKRSRCCRFSTGKPSRGSRAFMRDGFSGARAATVFRL